MRWSGCCSRLATEYSRAWATDTRITHTLVMPATSPSPSPGTAQWHSSWDKMLKVSSEGKGIGMNVTHVPN